MIWTGKCVWSLPSCLQVRMTPRKKRRYAGQRDNARKEGNSKAEQTWAKMATTHGTWYMITSHIAVHQNCTISWQTTGYRVVSEWMQYDKIIYNIIQYSTCVLVLYCIIQFHRICYVYCNIIHSNTPHALYCICNITYHMLYIICVMLWCTAVCHDISCGIRYLIHYRFDVIGWIMPYNGHVCNATI